LYGLTVKRRRHCVIHLTYDRDCTYTWTVLLPHTVVRTVDVSCNSVNYALSHLPSLAACTIQATLHFFLLGTWIKKYQFYNYIWISNIIKALSKTPGYSKFSTQFADLLTCRGKFSTFIGFLLFFATIFLVRCFLMGSSRLVQCVSSSPIGPVSIGSVRLVLPDWSSIDWSCLFGPMGFIF